MLIVTGSDDNYVPGVLVLIASAAFHNPGARFAVLDMDITPANRARIDALADRLGVRITRHEVACDKIASLHVRRAHLARSAYLRLLIPELFPQEARAIYMDCDMVVMGDLAPLARVALDGALIAACPCPSPDPIEVAATGHAMGSYVNSGLLVMDLDAWRAERVAEACLDVLREPDHPHLCEDQSAINIVARGRMRLLDPAYNTYSDPGAYKQVADLPQPPVVLHYVVNNKPWNIPITLDRIWHFHAARIAELMPPRRRLTLRRRLSLWNRNRKQEMGRIAGRDKYRARAEVIATMRRIEARYLDSARAAAPRDGTPPAA